MAGASIKITFDDSAVREALDRLARAGADLRPAFADIGEHLLISHRERWDRQVDPDGKPWKPLSDATLRRKMLKGVRRGKDAKRKSLTTRGRTKAGAIAALGRAQILVESGDLRDTLSYDARTNQLAFGTNRKYGATHQFGDPERGIPARPFLGLSGDDRDAILEILADHLDRALGRG